MHRRTFLAQSALAMGMLSVARNVSAQETPVTSAAPMNQDAYKPVERPAKPNAAPLLTDEQRDDLEHHLHCQCGCGLDVFTCRTTDFACTVSPRMHRDVMRLVSGGYSADEIKLAFREVYGERIFMMPVREGFNWVGYIAPFAALAGGAAIVVTLLKRWGRSATEPLPPAPVTDATPVELKRLQDALRSDDE